MQLLLRLKNNYNIKFANKNNMENRVSRNEYGVLTDLSKSLNMLFGDGSGRTVSRRTVHGFKRAFNINDLSDENAEHIIHSAMISTGLLLTSKKSNFNLLGLLLLIGLVACYQNGK